MRKIAVNDVGLTLVEVMIAMAVVAVVLLAATQGTIWMAKNNQTLATKSSQATASATGSRGFASAFETASIAVSYEHMPVPNGVVAVGAPAAPGNCTWDSTTPASFSGAAPCTAQLSGGSLYATGSGKSPAPVLSAATLLGGVSSIEFFRDDNAIITNNTNPFPWPGQNAVVQKTAPLTDSQLAPVFSNKNPFFTAWPLVIPAAGIFPTAPAKTVATYPLMVMQASTSTDPLIFSNITFSPNLPTPNVGRHVLMQATNFNDSPQIGTIYLIYNTYDPSQYIFQYAADVQDCIKSPALCQDIIDQKNGSDTGWDTTSPANEANNTWLPTSIASPFDCTPGYLFLCPAGSPPAPLPAAWFQNATAPSAPPTYVGDTIHYFAMDLEPIPDAAPLNTMYPSAASLFGGVPALEWFNSAGVAGGQSPAKFPYWLLTEFASVYDPTGATANFNMAFGEYGASGVASVGAGADIRKIAHYYQQILGSSAGQDTPDPNGGSIGTSAQFVAVPVTLKSFDLYGPIPATCTTKGTAGIQQCSTFNLVVNTLSLIGQNPEQATLMDHLPLAGTKNPATPMGAVVIARQIGGANFQMFYYSPGNVSVSSF